METQMNSEIPTAPASNPKVGMIAGAVALLVVGGIVGYVMGNRGVKPVVTTTPSSSASPSSNVTIAPTTTPTTVTQSKVYSNQYLTVTIPAGWSYSTTQAGAINIIKNNYILYINPAASQASGVEGGRFGEIAGGAPSSDAVNNGAYPGSCS